MAPDRIEDLGAPPAHRDSRTILTDTSIKPSLIGIVLSSCQVNDSRGHSRLFGGAGGRDAELAGYELPEQWNGFAGGRTT